MVKSRDLKTSELFLRTPPQCFQHHQGVRGLRASGTLWLYSDISPPCRCPYTLLIYARRKGWGQILPQQEDREKVQLFASYGASPDLHCERPWKDEAAVVRRRGWSYDASNLPLSQWAGTALRPISGTAGSPNSGGRGRTEGTLEMTIFCFLAEWM